MGHGRLAIRVLLLCALIVVILLTNLPVRQKIERY
jgi:hypothetical protein